MKPRHRAKFRALTVLQTLLLVVSITVLAYFLIVTDLLAVPLVVGAIVALQVIALIAFVESHVDTLEEFFAAINYEDFTRHFVEEDVDAELKRAFNRILDRFQSARAERDFQANYLESVVRHVPIPFLAARPDGSLSLVNNPARRLTGISTLRHIDELAELDPALPRQMRAIEPGHQQLLQTRIRQIPAELRVSVSEIRLAGEAERLYSIENLSGELTARESSAWRNLIRVLTHEIMNTLTPVASLAQTCKTMLEDGEINDDVREAVNTIARRSEGLMSFVSHYRELLHLPEPSLQRFSVVDVFNGLRTLMQDELRNIEVAIEVTPESLELEADLNLIEQVLLNLVRNAVDAVDGAGNGQIRLLGLIDHGRILLTVQDNGPPIPDSVLDQVFVPFFTTKRDGSGIGLSLSRQIMTAHGGEIAISSDESGTRVSLVF